jgi:Druantia protein DruA
VVTRSEYAGAKMRGRRFTPAELDLIKQLVERFYDEGRTRASEEICKSLSWRQPNGWLKDRACRDVLLRLEESGFLSLPPRKANPAGNKTRARVNKKRDYGVFDGHRDRLDPRTLCFRQVKGTELESQWNALVAHHHYLGFNVAVGRTLKYLVEDSEGPVAALSFSDPAWALKPRDALLGRLGWSSDDIRKHGISNTRFVIFPWARIPNLASAVLGRAVPHLRRDWLTYYEIVPRRGFKKRGPHHSNHQAPKNLGGAGRGTLARRALRIPGRCGSSPTRCSQMVTATALGYTSARRGRDVTWVEALAYRQGV